MVSVAQLNAAEQQARCEALEADNQRLRDRVMELEGIVNGGSLLNTTPREFGLTAKEGSIFLLLLGRESVASKEAIYLNLYGGLGETEIKIVDVFICKLRAKVEPYGILIETVWGQGYVMPKSSRDLARGMMNG